MGLDIYKFWVCAILFNHSSIIVFISNILDNNAHEFDYYKGHDEESCVNA